ncbi:M48 family metalloprotease [Minwuia thermotolerans]|uniref:Peptidase M48 domain-containing protein n=1 Tax=Minwuia thermotolerans TaxID=2056226 RepID=A0A2M9G5F3_9PROT|nr:M48 family metalloprotease [Minwuia thermotolerans]PJK30930.1 hypothetical protein CVT23_03440 [Minwuia thermotolerans]
MRAVREWSLSRLPLAGMGGVWVIAASATFGVWGGVAVAVAVALAIVALPHLPEIMELRIAHARPLQRRMSERFGTRLAEISRAAGLAQPPEIRVIDGAPNAFSIGDRRHCVILISRSLLELLSERHLIAVIAHEVAHVAAGDVRLIRFGEAMSRVTFAAAVLGLLTGAVTYMITGEQMAPDWVYWFLAFAPAATSLLQTALSRRREYAADARSVRLTGDPGALSQALARIQFANGAHMKDTIEEFAGVRGRSWMRTHPPVPDRIDRLQRMAGRN